MLNLSQESVVLAALVGGTVAKIVFGAVMRKNRQQNMVKVGTVTELICYPVKSCCGISVPEGLCTQLGLKIASAVDRHWMVVRCNGDFVTMRRYPKMALIRTEIHDLDLAIDAPGMPTLTVPLNPITDRGKVMVCRVWDMRTEGMDCGDDAAYWFSTYLQVPGLRLVFSASDLFRRDLTCVDKPWGNPCLPGDQSAFHDFCGYLFATEESLAAVNEKMQVKVTMKRFRPNIVVTGSPAFDEDNWKEVQIGESAVFRLLDPCTRCLMTTVNPETGDKDPKAETLETLKEIRCFPAYGTSPLFGVNATVDCEGIVRVGDPVYAIKK